MTKIGNYVLCCTDEDGDGEIIFPKKNIIMRRIHPYAYYNMLPPLFIGDAPSLNGMPYYESAECVPLESLEEVHQYIKDHLIKDYVKITIAKVCNQVAIEPAEYTMKSII